MNGSANLVLDLVPLLKHPCEGAFFIRNFFPVEFQDRNYLISSYNHHLASELPF